MKGKSRLSYLITLCFVFALALAVPVMAVAQSTEDWVTRYNRLGNGNDDAIAIAVDSEGNVYVTGNSWRAGTGSDCITVKYDSEGNPKWVAPYESQGDDGARAITVDAEGNVYITGTTQGVGYDYLTIKYSQPNEYSYHEDWVAIYNGTESRQDEAYAIAVDSEGNVYVTGHSNGAIEGGPEVDYATVKYNPNGNLKWVAPYEGPGNGDDIPVSIAVDAQGNVYVTGVSEGSGTGRDYATIKYSQPTEDSYNEDWVARYNNDPENLDDCPRAIAIDALGNVYVTGVRGVSGTGGDWADYATVKYDAYGHQKWVAPYDGPANTDGATAIAVDALGNVYVTGSSEGNGTGRDYATIKYSQPTEDSYNEDWVRRYNGPGNSGDHAVAIAVNLSGTVYVTGWSRGSWTASDYTTVKYDASGTLLWVGRYNGPGLGYDAASAIALDALGNVYVTGWSEGRGTGKDYATVKYSQPKLYTEEWVARYNGPGNGWDEASAIALDSSGNVYVTGESGGSGTNRDYATLKYDASSGKQVWEARYHGPGGGWDSASAIAVDAEGKIYVTGWSLGSGIGGDYATLKYDSSSGEKIWEARYDAGYGHKEAHAIAIDASGNVYVTGESNDPYYSVADYATVKYDPNGNLEWVAPYEGPGNGDDIPASIAVDAQGNVYVTGVSEGSGTGKDYATIKYSQPTEDSYREDWVARYEDPEDDYAVGIAVDPAGNVYVTGTSVSSGTDCSYATVKYDSEGNLQWIATYNGPGNDADNATAIALDSSGNVYVTGVSWGVGTNYDYATVKYDTDGEQLWVKRYDGSGSWDTDYARAIAVDVSGNVYVTGESDDYYSGMNYATVKYDTDGNEIWVARYGHGYDAPSAIAVDAEENIYVTGTSPLSLLDDYSYDYATIKYSQVSNTYSGGIPVDAGNGVTVTFEGVITKSGNTIATMTDQGPSPPTGFELAGTYYEITTTATYDGPITICIVYDDSYLLQEINLRPHYYNEAIDDWEPIPPENIVLHDMDENRICFITDHLSLFGLMYPVYQFSGFLPPVSLGRPFKLGRTVPVKFQLTDANGNYVTTALATLTLQRYVGDEPMGGPIMPTSRSAANTGNIFRYDLENNQYIYNLRTKDLQRGTYLMTVALDDGEEHTTFISLR